MLDWHGEDVEGWDGDDSGSLFVSVFRFAKQDP